MRARGVEVPESGRRQLLVSKGWVQAVVLVVLFGFFVLGLLTYRTYQAKPPIPQRVVDPAGEVLYTARRHRRGPAGVPAQRPHGVRLGVRARRLPRPGLHRRLPAPVVGLRPARLRRRRSDSAARRTIEDFRTNRYDERTGTLRLTAPQAEAHRRLVGHYSRFFSEPTTKHGLRRKAITDRDRARASSRPSSAGRPGPAPPSRPGHDYSYTNNWPPEPRVDNRADGERGRLVGPVADRAARRDRDPVRRLRPLGTAARLARPRAGDAVASAPRATWRSPRRSARARGSSS